MMEQKTVLAPYGVYVNVYEVTDGDRVLWFSEAEVKRAEARVRTHSETATPESLRDWAFKERF